MIRETMAERAARLRCAECGKWYMGLAQRDAHAVKVGHAARPIDLARKALATLPRNAEGVPILVED